MSQDNKARRNAAFFLIIALGIILGIAIYYYLQVFVWAFVLFVLFKPLYNLLIKENWKKKNAALTVMLLSFMLIILPFIVVGSLAVQEAFTLNQNRDSVINHLQSATSIVNEKFPELELESQIQTMVRTGINYLQSLLGPLVQGAGQFIVNLVMMYFVLYFLFVDGKKWQKKLFEYLPYSQRHSKEVFKEFSQVSNATIISSGIIAITQGLIVYISLLLVGTPSALIWGIVSTILAFLPVIGTPVVWIPAGVYIIAQGNWAIGIIFLAFHTIITMNIDNFLRPVLNNKFGNIHPLTSFVGVFFGLYLFGIMGIILGPLLINYFFLSIKLYKLEFSEN